MSNVQIIEKDGHPEWAVIPYADYRRLVDLVADIEDARDINAFRTALSEGREDLVPGSVVTRILDGESPLRVWREYRGLTQQALADAANVGKSYISQIESGKKTGTADTLGRLARTLKIDLEDLVGSSIATP
jgi:DNA-binding XRE family transcriptional regulator